MTQLPIQERSPQIVRSGAAAQAGVGPSMQEGPGLTGRDAVRILRKRMWLIILSLVITTAVAAGTTVVWLVYAPFYTAEAYLQVNPPKASELTETAHQPTKQVMDRLTRSYAQLVKSDSVLNNAVREPGISRTAWYRKQDPSEVVQELDEQLKVSPVPDTFFIRVWMTDPAGSDQERAQLADIVNTVCDAFVRDNTAAAQKDRREQLDRIGSTLKERQRELDDVRTLMGQSRPEDIPNIDERRNVLSIQLQVLARERVEREGELVEAQSALDTVLAQQARGNLEQSPAVQYAVDSDPTLQSLKNAEVNFKTELDDAKEKFGPDHRRVQTIRNRLDSIRRQIGEKEEQLVAEAGSALIQSRQADAEIYRERLAQVQERYEELTAQLHDAQANLAELKALAAQEEGLQERIKQLQQAEMDLSLLARGEEPVVLRSPATKPRRPSAPRWRVMLPLGIFGGLAIGLGLAFVLEFIDTSVKSPRDITRRVDLPVLGMVPHLEDLDEEIADLRLTFLSNPHSLIGESFRQIRTCLLFSGPPAGRRSLLVTSPMPEDGRSTVALNLAGAMASAGRRVLVVDSNFRQPIIRHLFPEVPEQGLSSALTGQANWRDLVCEVHENLHVISAGMLPPNPAELLGSEQMRTIISEMTDQFEQVIFDGAPCLVVSDSSVLSTVVDGVILVVRAGANTYGIVERTRDMVARVGAHILGVVVNAARVTAGGYYRRSYETFYEYHEQQRLPVGAPPADRGPETDSADAPDEDAEKPST